MQKLILKKHNNKEFPSRVVECLPNQVKNSINTLNIKVNESEGIHE